MAKEKEALEKQCERLVNALDMPRAEMREQARKDVQEETNERIGFLKKQCQQLSDQLLTFHKNQVQREISPIVFSADFAFRKQDRDIDLMTRFTKACEEIQRLDLENKLLRKQIQELQK